ncbi:uncharacterized protein CLUP02_13082 [Colletotrichum lupini]|uniref:Uncharacterized protein n=1 Tax=Colletotrichum lupini TaxID=145971 RepID=A0A9Q8T2F6_9PEZI|nr:uncharacterized protein CLUP02_13082 [Colletotrichum lupini]UQC87565.1 hypothetical protein CLUP02_13082 [Colletotrichum lupini]
MHQMNHSPYTQAHGWYALARLTQQQAMILCSPEHSWKFIVSISISHSVGNIEGKLQTNHGFCSHDYDNHREPVSLFPATQAVSQVVAIRILSSDSNTVLGVARDTPILEILADSLLCSAEMSVKHTSWSTLRAASQCRLGTTNNASVIVFLLTGTWHATSDPFNGENHSQEF